MLWTAFILGLAGSLHCVGMCGPIAMALPGNTTIILRFISGRLLYQFGRITTYIGLGAIAGILGKGISLFGVQQSVSVGLGLILILVAVYPTHKPLLNWTFLQGSLAQLKINLGKLLKHHQFASLFGVGLLNGLLPCGLVYAALTAALSTTGPLEASIYMGVFGLGTLPLMLATSFLGKLVRPQLRNHFSLAMKVCMICLGIFLVGRGVTNGNLHFFHQNHPNSLIEVCVEP